MKIAIVHDYIKEYGGAERVLEELIKIFPQAHVYTTIFLPEYLGPHRERFEKYDIRTSFLRYIPFNAKLISPLRLLSPLAFKSFDLSSYDVIIVSQTGAYFPNVVARKAGPVAAHSHPTSSTSLQAIDGSPSLRATRNKRPLYVTYTHTPPRYLYGYKTARDMRKNKIMYFLVHIMNHFLRMVDVSSAENVDQFIANSEEVKARIEKFYRREARVIYPPVSIPKIKTLKKENFYLTGGRLARAKGIDVIVDAFIKNKKPLKIFGRGFAGFEDSLKFKVKSSKSNNIEFVGEISDEKKFELMADAKAFIFASYDEDFGITPVESMGVGTPVIAFRSGGVKETVVDGVSGVFYDNNTPEELNRAIKKFEKILKQVQDDKFRDACVQQAEKFSEKVFDRKIKHAITEALISSQKP